MEITAATRAPDGAWHTLFFDGSVYPHNPGELMGLGYAIYGPASYQSEAPAVAPPTLKSIAHLTPMIWGSLQLGPGTNNDAEYQALLAGLRHALRRGIRRLKVVGDSELILRQVSGEWMCRSKSLQKLCEEAQVLVACFTRIDFQHIYREGNKRCDSFAKAGSRPGAADVVSDFVKRREGEPKFTPQQAALLRLFGLKYGVGYSVLGRVFNCTPTVARRAVLGTYYKHLTEEDLHEQAD